MNQQNNDFCGIMPVYKEPGFTSNDVVAKLRGILHMKKIGHTGTLDPAAEGVLPVCLGKGTKLVNVLTDTDKTYRCICRLGVATDTEDMTGTVTEKQDISSVTEEVITNSAYSFVGDYMQVPPMYSAKKVNGRKLYELARRGEVIEREPAHVIIRAIDIENINLNEGTFTFTVTCSKGTYIRTLCTDIGRKAGCCAAMEKLIRTRAGIFTSDESLKLGEIEDIIRSGNDIRSHIRSIDSMFPEYGRIDVYDLMDRHISNGNSFETDMPDGKYRVYLSDGRFAGIYEVTDKKAEVCRFFLT